MILIDKGGDLEGSFRELGPTYVIRPLSHRLYQKIWSRISYGSYLNCRLQHLMEIPVGLIYLNTFSNGRLADQLKKKFKCRLITHTHELESVIQTAGRKNIQLLHRITDHYIAASAAVKKNLIINHRIPENKITVHFEAIEPVSAGSDKPVNFPIDLKDSDFVVGGAGFVDYRKGFDLFLETARILVQEENCTHARFIWIGGFGRNKQKIVDGFIERHGLQNHVKFPGEMADPFPVYRRFNLFFLSSREDPYPLVMLENAYLGIPVIGFKGSGGADEFLDHDEELLADSFKAREAARKIMVFMKNKSLVTAAGRRLREKVREKHMIDRCGRLYYNRIIQLAGEDPGMQPDEV
ncbi:MAG: glycosyltransferase family 4 protein [Cyclobacteriaceae bacterium]|nr:glycosyltransferase family 4 protein [Cyclobacteriaceae bacterium]